MFLIFYIYFVEYIKYIGCEHKLWQLTRFSSYIILYNILNKLQYLILHFRILKYPIYCTDFDTEIKKIAWHWLQELNLCQNSLFSTKKPTRTSEGVQCLMHDIYITLNKCGTLFVLQSSKPRFPEISFD